MWHWNIFDPYVAFCTHPVKQTSPSSTFPNSLTKLSESCMSVWFVIRCRLSNRPPPFFSTDSDKSVTGLYECLYEYECFPGCFVVAHLFTFHDLPVCIWFECKSFPEKFLTKLKTSVGTAFDERSSKTSCFHRNVLRHA